MNKSYLIVPVILLAIFGFTYNGALKDMHAQEMAIQARAAKKQAEEAQRKAEMDAKATADAIKHQKERDAADLAKQQAKEAAYNDAMQKLNEEADDYAAQSVKLTKESSDLNAKIAAAQNKKEQIVNESLDLAKSVELAKIRRGNAEFEIQRMIEMVASKLNDSGITALPPPLLAEPAK